MKRFICLLVIFLQICLNANAETLTFLNNTYELKKVQKVSNNYINEYQGASENKIVISYLPKIESEFDYINDFINKIGNAPTCNLISFYPEINTFSFGVISAKKDNSIIEYNIIRCIKTKKNGINTVQYIRNYHFTDKESFKHAYDECMGNNLKYADALVKAKFPEIIKKQK